MMREGDPSPRVRLEVALLDTDRVSPVPDMPTTRGEHPCLTGLVVAGEADLRRYVRECLRERTDLRLLDAATLTAAVALAGHYSPDLLVVDAPEQNVLRALPGPRAIVIVDSVPQRELGPQVRLLARPFSARELLAEVGRLMG